VRTAGPRRRSSGIGLGLPCTLNEHGHPKVGKRGPMQTQFSKQGLTRAFRILRGKAGNSDLVARNDFSQVFCSDRSMILEMEGGQPGREPRRSGLDETFPPAWDAGREAEDLGCELRGLVLQHAQGKEQVSLGIPGD